MRLSYSIYRTTLTNSYLFRILPLKALRFISKRVAQIFRDITTKATLNYLWLY